MNRKEITAHHIEGVLEIFAQHCLSQAFIDSVTRVEIEFPYIQFLLEAPPDQIEHIFQKGDLEQDLERVMGMLWKWQVGEVNEKLQIVFYKNVPLRSQSSEEVDMVQRTNMLVAEFLNPHESK